MKALHSTVSLGHRNFFQKCSSVIECVLKRSKGTILSLVQLTWWTNGLVCPVKVAEMLSCLLRFEWVLRWWHNLHSIMKGKGLFWLSYLFFIMSSQNSAGESIRVSVPSEVPECHEVWESQLVLPALPCSNTWGLAASQQSSPGWHISRPAAGGAAESGGGDGRAEGALAPAWRPAERAPLRAGVRAGALPPRPRTRVLRAGQGQSGGARRGERAALDGGVARHGTARHDSAQLLTVGIAALFSSSMSSADCPGCTSPPAGAASGAGALSAAAPQPPRAPRLVPCASHTAHAPCPSKGQHCV